MTNRGLWQNFQIGLLMDYNKMLYIGLLILEELVETRQLEDMIIISKKIFQVWFLWMYPRTCKTNFLPLRSVRT